MRIAIISDIHANLEALKAVLKSVSGYSPDLVACLGDVVGYGADPDPCCDLVREHAAFCLMGNHDAAVTGAMDESYYYESARQVLRWTRDHLSDDNYRWLYGLPFTRLDGDIGYFHSAPILPSGFFYVVQGSEAQAHSQIFDRLKSLSFIGHAHLTHIFQVTPKKAKATDAKNVKVREDAKFIINVGSVGQPRDRDPRACWTLWDSETETLEHVRVEYDLETAGSKIVAAGLDPKFAKRLVLGV